MRFDEWARRPGARWILGTMNLGGRTPERDARAILDRAAAMGLGHVDTANAYGDGACERLVGAWLRGAARAELVVTTKVGLGRLKGPPEGLAPDTLVAAAEASRARLGVERIDLLLLHQPDPTTPLDETVSAIGGLVGHTIDAWGVSNHGAWQLATLTHTADRLGVPRPVAAQALYNPVLRGAELELLDAAQALGLHLSAYNPLAGGLLAGRVDDEGRPAPHGRLATSALYRRRYLAPPFRAFARALGAIAAAHGAEPAVLAYRWLLGVRALGAIVVGPAELGHLDAVARATADGPLDVALQAEVDAAYDAHVGRQESYARRPAAATPRASAEPRRAKPPRAAPTLSAEDEAVRDALDEATLGADDALDPADLFDGVPDADAMARAREALAREGYARLGRWVSDRGLAALRRRSDALMLGRRVVDGLFFQHDADSGRYDDLPYGEGWIGASRAYRKLEKLERDVVFRALLCGPFVRFVIGSIIPGSINLYRAILMSKPAGGGTPLPWHQDGGRLWGLDRDPEVQLWLALDDAPLDGGCLEVVPGTHAHGIATPLGGLVPEPMVVAADAERRAVALPAVAGEVVLLHNHVWHRAQRSTTGLLRRAFSAAFMPADTRCVRKKHAPRSFFRVIDRGV